MALAIGQAIRSASDSSPYPATRLANRRTSRSDRIVRFVVSVLRVAAVVIAVAACSGKARPEEPKNEASSRGWLIHQAENPSPNAAYRWMHVMQEASARSVERAGARPTIISREMHLGVTAMYDAWAAYDDKAVGTRLGAKLRRPPAERTVANKEKAVSYAMYRVLLSVYPEDAAWIKDQMRAGRLDPDDASTDPATPQGIGNLASAALLDYRRHDGSNQFGDVPGAEGPYSDYTGYQPVNPPGNAGEKLALVDPDRWQPLPFVIEGKVLHPRYLTPYWHKVKPFAIERADQFRPGPPPKVGSPELKADVDELIAANAHLSLEQKAIVEFMRDGPRSTGQSGHWLRFAADVSRRDHHTIDQDVKVFFAVGNVVFDAFISCWDTKRQYDSARPWTLVRHYYAGKQLEGYLGPCKGSGTIPAEQWQPYSPPNFITPPFPGYSSGHATASGAGARILELFTGSDKFEAIAIRTAGELTETQCTVGEMQARDGKPAALPASREVRLPLATFSDAAKLAAVSRMLGGYHIATDNHVGLRIGKEIADYSWTKYQAYWNGTATPRD
jgi:hypothetical protein